MKNYYVILDIEPNATVADIKEQYRFLMQTWHPDKYVSPTHKAKAAEKTVVINEAYEVLSNPARRADYDKATGCPSAGQNMAQEEAERQAQEQSDRAARERHAEAERQAKHRAQEEAERLEFERQQDQYRRDALRKVAEERERIEKDRLPREPDFDPTPVILTLGRDAMIEFVRIPAGEFVMGSTDADHDAEGWEKPQHKLRLDAYLIGKYAVTNAQYAAYAKATGRSWSMPRGKERHPVVQVSWDDAMAFCAWVSQATGRKVTLPTEAQWEKAARGTDGRLFPWGNSKPDAAKLNFDSDVRATTEVGQYSPAGDSPYGVADMAGNVWEWTSSLWGCINSTPTYGYPYKANDGREDRGSRDTRVLRGGGFDDGRWGVRSASRSGNFPADHYDNYGFRVVVSAADRLHAD